MDFDGSNKIHTDIICPNAPAATAYISSKKREEGFNGKAKNSQPMHDCEKRRIGT